MNEKYTYGFWGAAAGAVGVAIVGFSWGGWHTEEGAAQPGSVKTQGRVLAAMRIECMHSSRTA